MITITVACDWDKQVSDIEIKRINKNTGAYETSRYEIPRFSRKEKGILSILQSDRVVYSRYYGNKTHAGIGMSVTQYTTEAYTEYLIKDLTDG